MKSLSVKEAAKETGMNERTIRHKIKTGKLKADIELNEFGLKKYLIPHSELSRLTGNILSVGNDVTSPPATDTARQESPPNPANLPVELAKAQTEAEMLRQQLKEVKDDLENERQQKERWLAAANNANGEKNQLEKQLMLLTSGNVTGNSPASPAAKTTAHHKKAVGNVAKDDTKSKSVKEKPLEPIVVPPIKPVKPKEAQSWWNKPI